jgi:hypothetical protein
VSDSFAVGEPQVRHPRTQYWLSIAALLAFVLSVGGGSSLHRLVHQLPRAHFVCHSDHGRAHADHGHHRHAPIGPHDHGHHGHHGPVVGTSRDGETDPPPPASQPQPEQTCPVCLLLACGFAATGPVDFCLSQASPTESAAMSAGQRRPDSAAHSLPQPRAPPVLS